MIMKNAANIMKINRAVKRGTQGRMVYKHMECDGPDEREEFDRACDEYDDYCQNKAKEERE